MEDRLREVEFPFPQLKDLLGKAMDLMAQRGQGGLGVQLIQRMAEHLEERYREEGNLKVGKIIDYIGGVWGWVGWNPVWREVLMDLAAAIKKSAEQLIQ
jgi:hypothetical protein